MNKQIQIFFLASDEVRLSEVLLRIRPQLVFIDSNVWEQSEPVLVESIANCSSSICYLWDREIVERLPTIQRKDGRFEGPIAGPVIQLVRSRLVENVLLSGRIAVGASKGDLAMETFAAAVWKALRGVLGRPLSAVDGLTKTVIRESVKEYVAGLDAEKWVMEDERRIFRDRSVQVFFTPSRMR